MKVIRILLSLLIQIVFNNTFLIKHEKLNFINKLEPSQIETILPYLREVKDENNLKQLQALNIEESNFNNQTVQEKNQNLQQIFQSAKWRELDKLVKSQIDSEVFPGCTILVYKNNEIKFMKSQGTRQQGGEKTNINTLQDMASLTKVISATTAVMHLYQNNQLSLNDQVTKYLGLEFSKFGKDKIKIINLLLHNSGFPPDPDPLYATQGCGRTKNNLIPQFSCIKNIYNLLLNQKLINKIGDKQIYSDLSMITMMFVIGKIVKDNKLVNNKKCLSSNSTYQCQYETQVKDIVFNKFDMKNTVFLPNLQDSQYNCSPTLNSNLPCVVEDPNTFAMGGISGHAGLFSNILDINNLLNQFLNNKFDKFISNDTIKYFTTVYNKTQSSRALGWNTNQNNDTWCGEMSKKTQTHTGYTGTQVCVDPINNMQTILLTNRVYPDDSEQTKKQILVARNDINNEILNILRNNNK